MDGAVGDALHPRRGGPKALGCPVACGPTGPAASAASGPSLCPVPAAWPLSLRAPRALRHLWLPLLSALSCQPLVLGITGGPGGRGWERARQESLLPGSRDVGGAEIQRELVACSGSHSREGANEPVKPGLCWVEVSRSPGDLGSKPGSSVCDLGQWASPCLSFLIYKMGVLRASLSFFEI